MRGGPSTEVPLPGSHHLSDSVTYCSDLCIKSSSGPAPPTMMSIAGGPCGPVFAVTPAASTHAALWALVCCASLLTVLSSVTAAAAVASNPPID